MSLAEWRQLVTSMMVPPARTKSGGWTGLGGVFCTAMDHVPAAKDRTAAQTDGPGRTSEINLKMEFENRLSGDRSGNQRGNNCLRDGIVRVFPILLHGGWANETA